MSSSPSYNFTARIRNVLSMAREEAARLDHEYVGTEHLLLAIVREGEGVATAVLQALGADLRDIKQAVEKNVRRGNHDPEASPDLPYTTRSKKVLELTMAEAEKLQHSYVGTDHLLLGLIAEGKGVGAQVLAEAGITYEKALAETRRQLGSVEG
ncbi:MAG: hypothetical protein H7Z40_09755 [Phycisphaerae bacterium]|nr:hypothetical protein [Gemmatimonadaceae bacterium]